MTTHDPHRDPIAVPEPPRGRRGSARDAILVVGIAVLVLILCLGDSIENGAEELEPGVGRDIVMAVGEPLGWVADQLPFAAATDDALGWISPGSAGGTAAASGSGDTTLLVTGDSLSMPLDAELARRYAGGEVRVVRDPHVGTGISKSGVVDWSDLARRQVRKHRPDAVVVFIGANEGFPLPSAGGQTQCCGEAWQAAFAQRVERMLETYLQGGDARVYWLTVPMPRDSARQEIARAVNAAVESAADRHPDDVRLLDMVEAFTPGGRYSDAIEVDGRERIVRESDGIHLNAEGSALAAGQVQAAVDEDLAD